MSKKYQVTLIDIGPRKDTILSYLQEYSELGNEAAENLLSSLPAVIATTSTKLEANIIKQVLQSYGAVVEITVDTSFAQSGERISYSNTSDKPYNPVHNDLDEYSKAVVAKQNRGLIFKADVTDKESMNPVYESKGCGLVLLAGFLVFVTLIAGVNLL
jgi:hypothetical protein